jgi:hypothetical protein
MLATAAALELIGKLVNMARFCFTSPAAAATAPLRCVFLQAIP